MTTDEKKKLLARDLKRRIRVFTKQVKEAAEKCGIDLDVLVHISEKNLNKEKGNGSE